MKRSIKLSYILQMKMIAVLYCFFVLIGTGMYFQYYRELDISKNQIIDERYDLDKEIRNELSRLHLSLDLAKNATFLFERRLDEKESLDIFRNTISRIISSSESLYNGYFAFEPQTSLKYFKKKAFIQTTHKNRDLLGTKDYGKEATFISETWLDDIYQTSEAEVWYHVAKTSTEPVFSKIYFDSTYMKVWMITAAQGIYENGKYVGMVGIDILLDALFASSENTVIGSTGGAFVFETDSGVLLSTPKVSSFCDCKSKYESSVYSFVDKSVFAQNHDKQIVIIKNEKGEEFYASIEKIDGTPWSLFVFQGKNEIIDIIFKNGIQLAAISLILLIILIVIFIRNKNAIEKPIARIIKDGINAIENGRLDVRIPTGISEIREFEQLIAAFNKMSLELKSSVVSKEYIENIIESINDVLFITNKNGIIRKANKSAAVILEFDTSEIIGESVFKYMTSNSKEKMSRLKSNAFTTFQEEIEIVSKSGKVYNYLASCSEIVQQRKDSSKDFVFNLRNITERVKFDNEKEEHNKTLLHSAKMIALGELSSSIAHEINNPLAIIKANLELIGQNENMSNPNCEQNLKSLAVISKTTDRIVKIVAQLRKFARIDMTENEKLDVHATIEEIVGMLKNIYKKINISFAVNSNAEKFFVTGANGKLHQIFMNLFSNAKDAVVGKEEGLISVSTKNIDHKLVIDVTDNGLGISKEHLPRIFDSFYTTKPAGQGTGLGLSIVNSIVREFGGDIKVSTKENEGTTFSITFPLAS